MKFKLFEGFWKEGIYNNEVNDKNKLSLSECDYLNKDNNIVFGIS